MPDFPPTFVKATDIRPALPPLITASRSSAAKRGTSTISPSGYYTDFGAGANLTSISVTLAKRSRVVVVGYAVGNIYGYRTKIYRGGVDRTTSTAYVTTIGDMNGVTVTAEETLDAGSYTYDLKNIEIAQRYYNWGMAVIVIST